MPKNKLFNILYIFFFLLCAIFLWSKALDIIFQSISIMVILFFSILPYIDKKNIAGFLMLAFFSSLIFISVYAIIFSYNNFSKVELEEDIKTYGLIGGSFFWSSILFFVIYNIVKNKKNTVEWKNNLKIQGKIILKTLFILVLLIVCWAVNLYIWKGIEKININLISKKIIMIFISWISFSILLFSTLSFLNIKHLWMSETKISSSKKI